MRRRYKKRTIRRGQAEVVGGLIILTILMVLVIPMLLKGYQDVTRLTEQARDIETRVDIKFKERISISGTRLEDVGPDLWPGLWINNTGTIQVTLKTLFIINMETGSVVAALDLTQARPGITPLIENMYLNPDPTFSPSPPPPAGNPIILKPGDKLYIVFNDAHPAMLNPEKLMVRILSGEGVLHPLTGEGQGQGLLVPPKMGEAEFEPWKGAFNPYAGFKLIGGEELLNGGKVIALQPSLYIRDLYIPYDVSFIYDDDTNPGLYRIHIEVDSGYWWWWEDLFGDGDCVLYSGDTLEIYGFLGTYFTYGVYTYLDGYAAKVVINGNLCKKGTINYFDPSNSVEISDFDGNGVNELVMYSLKNGPLYSPLNVDADYNGYEYHDALGWIYIAQRDISGQDFIRITGKLNYYWTMRLVSGGADVYRNLRIFSIVVWEYDPTSGSYTLRHYRDYSYTENKPQQFQFSTVFPLDRNKTYRIGMIFYDNYAKIDNPETSGYSYLEFTYALEYLVVEYGRYNPLFSQTPPIYIVAIPDPSIIQGIGEAEYASYYGLTINDAKLAAQSELLNLTIDELEKNGLIDYIVISDVTSLCSILFNSPSGLANVPPKYAVVIWLQGNASISSVAGSCGVDDSILLDYVKSYHWVFAQISGRPLWGSISYFAGGSQVKEKPGGGANITDPGLNARIMYKAYLMPIEAEFEYLIEAQPSCLVDEATFYHNTTYTIERYGTMSFWASCIADPTVSGIFMVNPVNIDWAGDGDGVLPGATVQMALYAALEAYKILTP
ncbi:MAG: hypothetical protein F7C81_04620 [Desulfurococcales archaeon]|nr:hypothetical protein [Desulfurococcales archaeon]